MKRDLLELFNELGHIVGTGRRNWFLIDASASGLGASIWLFTKEQIWVSPQLIIIITIVTVVDFFAGVAIAARRNQIETRKARRLFYTLCALIGLLIVAHQCAKADPVNLGWMPLTFFMPMLLTQLASVIKNLSLLGYLPTKYAKALYKSLDAYKNPNDKQDGKE